MKNVEIIYKSKNIIVVNKPAGIPSQPDPSGDKDALTLSSEALASLGERTELYLINRLDRVVGGLIILARNKRFATALTELVSGEKMVKEYIAVVSGRPEAGRYTDYLYKDARLSKAFVVDGKRQGVKEALLDCMPLVTESTDDGEKTLLRVRLYTGRYHQIRCQLASRGYPIVGDGKYGSRDKGARLPALFAEHISFEALGERVDVLASPDTAEYPWNLFLLDMERTV